MRPPNHSAECQLLLSLSNELTSGPDALVRRLVRDAKKLCRAGTAGLSELAVDEQGKKIFRWTALAGAYAPYIGGSTPRNFSPCGTCLDRGCAQLYDRPQRFFTYLKKVKPPVGEVLIIPLLHGDHPLGTIWIVSHDAGRRFDSEDVRIMTSIAGFLGAALHQSKIHEQCQKNESFSRAILSASPDCIKVLDASGRILYINESGKKLLRISRSRDVLGQRWVSLWKGEGKRAATKALRSARAGASSQFQSFRPTLTGEPRWWDVTVSLLPGKERQTLVISRDITALKMTEQALRKSENTLASRAFDLESEVAQRTGELKNSNEHLLLVSRKMLHLEEEERRRIAKELHDEFGQHLTGLKLILERLGFDNPVSESPDFDRAQGIIATLMQQVRDFSFDLRKSLPEHISLVSALAWQFEKLKSEHGLEIAFKCSKATATREYPPEIKRTILRVVQEALTNVLRHANTFSVRVELRVQDDHVKVSIGDRGRGFNPQVAPDRRNGLDGMRERIRLHGGTFGIKSKPGDGTSIEVELPLENR